MVSVKTQRCATTVAVFVLAIVMVMVSSALVSRSRIGCFGFGVEYWLLAFAACLAGFALLGLFFLWKNYVRCYMGYIAANAVLALALLASAIAFLTIVASPQYAEKWWKNHHVTDDMWEGVVQCFVRTNYCAGLSVDAPSCCHIPDVCAKLDTVERDCIRWTPDGRCYGCDTCRAATFHHARAFGRRVMPVILTCILILPFVVALQACVERRRQIAA